LPPSQRRYANWFDCYKKIITKEGIKGLWTGMVPNIMRNSIINAAEIASYDQYKQMSTQNLGLPDCLAVHIACAFGAGFNAVVVGSPVDVLKTRLMNKLPGETSNPVLMIG
jgi:solute carrier family 25 uncoupling protein 8/9